MPGRDQTAEILEIKQRNAKFYGFRSGEMKSLLSRWLATAQNNDSTPDFYLIRAVTILEVSARQELALLIDHGKAYTDRAVELSKNFKMDFATVRDIQGRAITLGDIVAHSVPVNSFGKVLSHFEILLGKPLRPLLANAVDRWRIEIEGQPSAPIIGDFDTLACCLSRLFDIRHILCHELPEKPVYSVEEVTEFLGRALEFMKALGVCRS